jgi:hypothetical protein
LLFPVLNWSILVTSLAIPILDWIVARISIGSGAEISRSFPSHQLLGFGPGEELGLRCGGFWREATRNSSKLHEVLGGEEKAQACTYIVEFGYRALRELNLTRNLEYVLGRPYLLCLSRQGARCRFGRGVAFSRFWHFSRHLISYPGSTGAKLRFLSGL